MFPDIVEQLRAIEPVSSKAMSDTAENSERFIVVGVDGSEPSRKALRWAAEQARLTGATLRVLTTWEVATGTGWVPTFPVDYDPEAMARRALDEAIDETLGADPGIPVERVVKVGHAAPVLLAAAKDADLLVVGSHGHGAFAGMLIGSVSEHLVRHAPCAIVVVHCDRHSRH
jgi:nucleotide-binding universal stress UspA family protein